MPDPDDRHVLAAAVAADADILCTLNIKDFPPAAMQAAGVDLKSPNDVLLQLIADFPAEMAAAHAKAVRNLKGATDESTLHTLRRAQCGGASDALARVLDVAASPSGSSVPESARCAVCGRPLKSPESIARGAGPKCAKKS
jgi:hypothetical protein